MDGRASQRSNKMGVLISWRSPEKNDRPLQPRNSIYTITSIYTFERFQIWWGLWYNGLLVLDPPQQLIRRRQPCWSRSRSVRSSGSPPTCAGPTPLPSRWPGPHRSGTGDTRSTTSSLDAPSGHNGPKQCLEYTKDRETRKQPNEGFNNIVFAHSLPVKKT